MYGKGLCICWPGSLLAQMGLLDVPFDLQVKEVYLGKQFFSKEIEIGEIMGTLTKCMEGFQEEEINEYEVSFRPWPASQVDSGNMN